MAPPFAVRRFEIGEAALLQQIRLLALQEAGFTSARPTAVHLERVDRSIAAASSLIAATGCLGVVYRHTPLFPKSG